MTLQDLPAEAAPYSPRLLAGTPPALVLTIDDRLYGAHVEDGLLVVHGVSEGGQTLPTPRAGFLVRVDGSARLELEANRLL